LGCALVTYLVMISSPAPAACGERGGPGYRGPNGRCVGWMDIGRTCGHPPTLRCTPEMANPGAEKAADHGVKALQAKKPLDAK
jgi:hypothetical protein